MTGPVLSVAGGAASEIKGKRAEVLDYLKSLVADIESGEISPNIIAVTWVDSDVSKFVMSTGYRGRAVEVLGYMELGRDDVKNDIRGIS